MTRPEAAASCYRITLPAKTLYTLQLFTDLLFAVMYVK